MNTNKTSHSFWVFFFLIFLTAPIYVNEYSGGIELGVRVRVLPFGGMIIFHMILSRLLFIIGATDSYPVFFGQLFPAENSVLLIFVSSIGALIASKLMNRFLTSNKDFLALHTLSLVIQTVLRASVTGLLINSLLAVIISVTIFDWLFEYTRIVSSFVIAIPLTMVGLAFLLIYQLSRDIYQLTRGQKIAAFLVAFLFSLLVLLSLM